MALLGNEGSDDPYEGRKPLINSLLEVGQAHASWRITFESGFRASCSSNSFNRVGTPNRRPSSTISPLR